MNIYNLANELLEEIKPQVKLIELAGSIRRGKKDPGDIDFVIIPNGIQEIDIKLKYSISKNWDGTKKVQHVLGSGIKVDLLFTTTDSFGAALLYFTGSQWSNIKMRSKAKNIGMKLNEYGLYDLNGNYLAGKTEEEIFNTLGMKYKIPQERV